MDSIIFQRVSELCREKGISVTGLERELGVANSAIQKWRSATSPSVETIKKVAQYFNVSVDYLVGTTDIRDTANNLLNAEDGIITLQRAMNRMKPSDKAIFAKMVRGAFEYAFEEDNSD